MSRGWKTALMVVSLAGIVSTPLFWLLDGPDTGQLVGASVQAAASIAALLYAILAAPASDSRNRVVRTGSANARDGGQAVTGIKLPNGRGDGSSTATDTGPSTATGQGSRAVSGIDHGGRPSWNPFRARR
ncbi:hypothetical protein V1460_21375 [Streptomyces sp. SCSIO 30461]|uniref:hypothetical protein n=1 Tax=Streptomyces sp. SCSIO 30461 TaxID=3118085 RepID=UPI0030CEA2B9